MVQHLAAIALLVRDYDEAIDFYVGKLGFEVRTDATMGKFRWLTVGPKTQPDFELILMKLQPSEMGPMGLTPERAQALRQLVEAGVLGAGVFEVDDCRKTYEELKAKGVTFKFPPTERFYGIETVVQDNSGNWFSLTQRK